MPSDHCGQNEVLVWPMLCIEGDLLSDACVVYWVQNPRRVSELRFCGHVTALTWSCQRASMSREYRGFSAFGDHLGPPRTTFTEPPLSFLYLVSFAATLTARTTGRHPHPCLPPALRRFLRGRSVVPRIFTRTTVEGKPEERLLILGDEPSGGRPIGAQYWDRDEKLKFMDKHAIDVSIVRSVYRCLYDTTFSTSAMQLRKSWLDFVPASTAHTLEMSSMTTSKSIAQQVHRSSGRDEASVWLRATPTRSGDHDIVSLTDHRANICAATSQGHHHGHARVGKGLDDDALDPVWSAIEKAGLVVFLHPHYGVDEKAWGDRERPRPPARAGLSIRDHRHRHPDLRLLLAHSGGALPQISSRLASCIEHDPAVASRLKHDARYYLGKLYFDAVAYGSEELGFVSDVIGRAEKYEKSGSSAAVSKGQVSLNGNWGAAG
ncbi:2-amino-3-carboxymuconate-6-semialdehyde decarboxylase [Grifola frondosa]|uniref:2-amino-3-carboxymuconate-6-semialdehyde decarboxylase n=1 Tax=Grifola frondosa TaxID=5627 RepID=A0A1C7MQ51_GRIFR|nr:2-amino-3-carboxymuconate-6-semialdehyde decarboxylase [Grifola frondosa]